ncbi:glutamate formimidoyltransferase [Fagus crenata]
MKIVVILAVFATEPSRALLSSSPISATDSVANFCPSNSDVGLESFGSISVTEDKKKTINQSVLLCCKVFISESRNLAALDKIEQAARLNPETVIVSKFEDKVYNRVRFTLVSYVQNITGSPIYSPLQQTVLAMVEAAFGAINFELHTGNYPRLGVVDDILIHPLGQASLNEAVWLAKAIAADIGNQFQVPIFLYNEAHPTKKALTTIRHELGYYKPNTNRTMPDLRLHKPDEGPSEISQARGIATIGARPWVDLYNIPILSTNDSVIKRIAKGVREWDQEQGGGHRTVQTLGLVHGEDSEILCMLLEPNKIGADQIQNWVEMLAAEEGLIVQKGYYTDFSEERTIEVYMNLTSAKIDQSKTIEQLVISTKFQFSSGVANLRTMTLDPKNGGLNMVLEFPTMVIRLTILIPPNLEGNYMDSPLFFMKKN